MLQHRIQLFWLTKKLFASVLSVDIIIIICVCHVLYLLVFLLSAFRWRPWMHFILKNISSICLYLTSIVCSPSSLEMFYFFRSIPIFFFNYLTQNYENNFFFQLSKTNKRKFTWLYTENIVRRASCLNEHLFFFFKGNCSQMSLCFTKMQTLEDIVSMAIDQITDCVHSKAHIGNDATNIQMLLTSVEKKYWTIASYTSICITMILSSSISFLFRLWLFSLA